MKRKIHILTKRERKYEAEEKKKENKCVI